ncbi:MAG TPA: helix-turn-helix domain-containing protein [Solirubrobacterales bacterium]|nr:helix-turn-helix domain-containing protein [Solirubrobacterales bacterium]
MSASADKPDPQRRPADGATAARVRRNPIRWFLAMLLSDRPMSASELARAAEMEPTAVRRHLREMEKAGAIELLELRRRRGTNEKFYRLCSDFVISDEERAKLTLEERRRIDAYTLKVALGEALRSLVSRPTASSQGRADNCLTRVPMVLDEEGWTELARLHYESYLKVMDLREQVERRLRSRGEEGIRATSLILFFEVSPPG